MKSLTEQFKKIEKEIKETAFKEFTKNAEDKLRNIKSGESIAIKFDTNFGVFSMGNLISHFQRKNYSVDKKSSHEIIVTKK